MERSASDSGSTTPSDGVEAGSFERVVALKPKPAAAARLVALMDGQSVEAGKFDVLSMRLKQLQSQRSLRKVLVTSSVAGEGKSLISANLAVNLARSRSQKVLLLEGDLRQPSLSRLFGFEGLKGLSDYLQGDQPASNYTCRLDPLQLWFLPAGTVGAQPFELLQSERLSELLTRDAAWFDWIVIDAPSLLPWADTNVLSSLADGALLVVQKGKTPKKLLLEAMEGFDHQKLLGVVLNECTEKNHIY